MLVHLQHPLREESQEIVHHVRFFLFGDEAPRAILGQAGIHLGEEFSEFAVEVELLAASGGSAQARG